MDKTGNSFIFTDLPCHLTALPCHFAGYPVNILYLTCQYLVMRFLFQTSVSPKSLRSFAV